MGKKVSKAYEPKEVEEKIYKLWERGKFFTPKIQKGKKPFVTAMPLPNITGSLHVGHVLNNSIQDVLTRYHRMKQEPTLWMPGTDHAGIATQNVVEKELKKQDLTRHDLGREKFIKRIWEWKEKYCNLILEQLKKMGCSCDWSRARFTLDKDYIKAVETAFMHYYKKGWIYQGPRIVNWCPRCSTAISDIEVKYVPRKTKLWYLKYPIKQQKARDKKQKYITVATTRPETMLGDTAVAINPKDERYKDLKGKKVILPLMNREIPVIADHRVESEFGTGAVKITPAHDATDNKIGKEHRLEVINVIGEDGKMTKEAKEYAGLEVLRARKKIIEDLKKQNLLEKEEDYEHSLSLCDRCDTPIEPLISKQWFIKMNELAKPAIKVVKENKVKFIPNRYKKVYLDWMENIEDWCISRQLWWGHRIPIWYCGEPDVKRMGFAASIVPRLRRGKVTTWRLRNHDFRVGDKVIFINSGTQKAFGHGAITDVKCTTVGKLPPVDPSHHVGSWTRRKIIQRFSLHDPNKRTTETTPVWIYSYKFEPLQKRKITCGEPIALINQPKKCPVCSGQKFVQSQDVLDTWFSSALWPFAHLGWPKKTEDLKYFYPTTVLSTARDIIYLWVARMIFSSLEFCKMIPFKDVYIHSTILTLKGRRMSKSLGTGVDPIELINRYGADAIRFGLLYLTSRDQQAIKFSEDAIKASRNFANKLWNVNRFISMNSEQHTVYSKNFSLADKWILSRLNTLIKEISEKIENYQLGEAVRQLYDFVWHEYADWYIELSKLQEKDFNQEIFKIILQLLHPFMPFITEHIWQINYKNEKALIVSKWPKANKKLINKKAESEFEKIKQKIIEIRKKKPNQKLQDIDIVKKLI